eukprot:scaffold3538_cov86-Skeletonema_dohrnii-CCMP3373.AAC.5
MEQKLAVAATIRSNKQEDPPAAADTYISAETMDPSDVERMRLKKQQQNAQRNEKETAEESTVEDDFNVSEELAVSGCSGLN